MTAADLDWLARTLTMAARHVARVIPAAAHPFLPNCAL
jgi:hypothetical protein